MSRIVVYLVWAIIVLYTLVAIVYAIQGADAATGLPGYLLTLQLQLLGTASWKTAALFSMCCYIIPLALASKLVATIAPEQTRKFWAASEAMRGEPPIYWLTWQFIFAVTGLMLLGTMVVSALLYFQVQQDQRALVYELDLDHGPVPPSRDAKFVSLTGHVARKFVSAYRQGDHVHFIAPVTDAGWSTGKPVRYFVHSTTYGSTEKPDLPDAFREAAASFRGKLGGRLPDFIQREYIAKGLRIDPSYSVIDWGDLPNTGTQSMDMVYVALLTGGMVTGGAFFIMVLMRLRRQFSAGR